MDFRAVRYDTCDQWLRTHGTPILPLMLCYRRFAPMGQIEIGQHSFECLSIKLLDATT